jgi:two-component system response regulator DesR
MRLAATLAAAIRRVHGVGRAIDAEFSAEAWAGEDPLTDLERQVLRIADDGSVSADSRQIEPLRRHGSQLLVGSNQQGGGLESCEAARIARPKKDGSN